MISDQSHEFVNRVNKHLLIIVSILKCEEATFLVRHVDVQRQSGGSDCGLFVIAFALLLCQRVNPCTQTLIPSVMRSHLLRCFEDEKITNFPTSLKSQRTARAKIISEQFVDVYCTCRLPRNKHYDKLGALIQCDKCKKRYHTICCGISSTSIHDSCFLCQKC